MLHETGESITSRKISFLEKFQRIDESPSMFGFPSDLMFLCFFGVQFRFGIIIRGGKH